MLTHTGTTRNLSLATRGTRAIAWAACVLLASTSVASADDQRPMVTLPVVVYDYIGVPAADLAGMMNTVTRIYREPQVEMAWTVFDRDRLARAAANPGSDDTRIPGALAVHLRTKAMTEACKCHERVLGIAITGSRQAWIYTPRVERLAATARLDFGLLLGHVVAHEMGHLLLARAGHSLMGLMSATLNLPDIGRGGVFFNAGEHESVRTGLLQLSAVSVATRRQ